MHAYGRKTRSTPKQSRKDLLLKDSCLTFQLEQRKQAFNIISPFLHSTTLPTSICSWTCLLCGCQLSSRGERVRGSCVVLLLFHAFSEKFIIFFLYFFPLLPFTEVKMCEGNKGKSTTILTTAERERENINIYLRLCFGNMEQSTAAFPKLIHRDFYFLSAFL